MITHRMSTQPAPEPPVRFYKIIAISFLLLTIGLLGVVVFVTSKKATITVIAKEDARNVSVTVPVGSGQSSTVLKGMVTTTAFYWSEKFQPTGNKTVDGTATGEAIIYNKTNSDQVLVKTTRLLTPNGVLFRLAERTAVPANGQVTVPVYADQPGAGSEIGPSNFTIPGLPTEKQQIIYAESTKPMAGGARKVGVLSDADIKTAMQNYKEKVKEQVAKTGEAGMERIVTVTETKAAPSAKVGDEVSEFTISGTSTAVFVSYNLDDLNAYVNRALSDKIDATAEKLLSFSGKPNVTIHKYDVRGGTAELSVTQGVAVTLDSDVEKLAPQNFVSKKKDEIERYILGLDHVTGVEVKFSPSWSFSAPTVPDKIQVKVKNIQ